MKTAVLAWECGAGRGHIVHLLECGRALKAMGWKAVFAFQSLATTGAPAAVGDVVQGPVWPFFLKRNHGNRERMAASFADILADIGFMDGELVSAMTGAWQAILRDADLLIADHSPGALLAARGRLPVIVTGTGFSVPCQHEGRLPALRDDMPPSDAEERILELLHRLGHRTLSGLGALYEEANPVPKGLALLDPYRAWRPYDLVAPGPIDALPMPAGPDEHIVCYLHELGQYDDVTMAGLMLLGARVRVYIPRLQPDRAAYLESAGVRVEREPMPMMEALAQARAVLHYGGHGLACEAVLAGRPQILLPIDLEKQIYSSALVAAGVGLSLQPRRMTSDALVDAVDRVLGEPQFARAAGELARSLAAPPGALRAGERIAVTADNLTR